MGGGCVKLSAAPGRPTKEILPVSGVSAPRCALVAATRCVTSSVWGVQEGAAVRGQKVSFVYRCIFFHVCFNVFFFPVYGRGWLIMYALRSASFIFFLYVFARFNYRV